MVNTLKKIQGELRAKELLQDLTLLYELPAKEFSDIQKEFYKLSHPAMEGYEEKDMFQADLLDVNFIFTKKE
jgi:hypothetical protein